MRATALDWTLNGGWRAQDGLPVGGVDLIIYFGVIGALESETCHCDLVAAFPGAAVAGCSTGGQISGGDVVDIGAQAIAIGFDRTRVEMEARRIGGVAHSAACGRSIGSALAAVDLAAVIVLSEGLEVNAGELLAGMQEAIGTGIPIVGGLAGDGPRFEQTLVGAGAIQPGSGIVAAIGLYGNALRFGHGCCTGWDAFGPQRLITAAEGRVLKELDGESALALYERYLGPEAEGLPHTGLLYPLRIWDQDDQPHDVLRTVLGVDREAGTMTFAADIPLGWRAQLMRGRFDGLSRGAAEAVDQARAGLGECPGQQVAFLVSCVGRRLVLGQHITFEIEAAMQALGPGILALGFYAHGEIAPHSATRRSELHNQTMTAFALGEAA